jgi:hypothetical protein
MMARQARLRWTGRDRLSTTKGPSPMLGDATLFAHRDGMKTFPICFGIQNRNVSMRTHA